MSKKPEQQLVNMKEMKKLFEYTTASELYIAKEIADTWEHRDRGNWETLEGDWQWDLLCMIAAAYITGRTQGIREERQRRKPLIRNAGRNRMEAKC